MPHSRRGPLLLLLSWTLLAFPVLSVPAAAALPVFFFHGLLSNSQAGRNIAVNFTAEGRVFVPLSFCSEFCSIQNLNTQVQLAITQIQDIVKNDSRFDDGYVFLAHSQGGMIARAVIEEMDDHKVKTFICMGGVVSGIFHGPQPEDASGVRTFIDFLSQYAFPQTLFNASKYAEKDLNGTFQYDINVFARDHPDAQQYSHFNLARSPVEASWLSTNKFLPVYNNLSPCAGDVKCKIDQSRRRRNFLKLKAAHYFASPADGLLTPWQTSILGQYNELKNDEEIKTKFSSMHVLDMKNTTEYRQDSYGLRALDARGGLFRHVLVNVTHRCWTEDAAPCVFQDVYDQHIYPLLMAATRPC